MHEVWYAPLLYTATLTAHSYKTKFLINPCPLSFILLLYISILYCSEYIRALKITNIKYSVQRFFIGKLKPD